MKIIATTVIILTAIGGGLFAYAKSTAEEGESVFAQFKDVNEVPLSELSGLPKAWAKILNAVDGEKDVLEPVDPIAEEAVAEVTIRTNGNLGKNHFKSVTLPKVSE